MNVSPEGHGTVKVGQNSPSIYPYTYELSSGTQVHLEAIPASGYRFHHWSGSLSGDTNPTTLLIDCDKTVTANFSLNWYLLGELIGIIFLIVLVLVIIIIRSRAHRAP